VDDNDREGEVKNWCTCWPDRLRKVYYGACCEIHDMGYSVGGDAEERKRHDKNLKKCVQLAFEQKGKKKLGWFWGNLMYIGVRVGASRWFCKYISPRTHQRFNWNEPEDTDASS